MEKVFQFVDNFVFGDNFFFLVDIFLAGPDLNFAGSSLPGSAKKTSFQNQKYNTQPRKKYSDINGVTQSMETPLWIR